jgi:hypothetical protein
MCIDIVRDFGGSNNILLMSSRTNKIYWSGPRKNNILVFCLLDQGEQYIGHRETTIYCIAIFNVHNILYCNIPAKQYIVLYPIYCNILSVYMKVTLTVNRCGTKGLARW